MRNSEAWSSTDTIMAPMQREELALDFPAGLAKPALYALRGAGFTRLDQFTRVSAAELRRLQVGGNRVIYLISAALRARGQAFRAEGAGR